MWPLTVLLVTWPLIMNTCTDYATFARHLYSLVTVPGCDCVLYPKPTSVCLPQRGAHTLCVEEPTALRSTEPGLKQVLTGAEDLGTLPGRAESLVACLWAGMAGPVLQGRE